MAIAQVKLPALEANVLILATQQNRVASIPSAEFSTRFQWEQWFANACQAIKAMLQFNVIADQCAHLIRSWMTLNVACVHLELRSTSTKNASFAKLKRDTRSTTLAIVFVLSKEASSLMIAVVVFVPKNMDTNSPAEANAYELQDPNAKLMTSAAMTVTAIWKPRHAKILAKTRFAAWMLSAVPKIMLPFVNAFPDTLATRRRIAVSFILICCVNEWILISSTFRWNKQLP